MDQQGQNGPEPPRAQLADPDAKTRRTFLAHAGKRAAFVAPAVWMLGAQQALAQASTGSCSGYAAPCAVDDDCCSLNCHGPTMTCKG